MDEMLTVGQVARTYGVTVRTLHHYDEIGLLQPSERTPAGYRVYTGVDLERLSTVVVYRRLGFTLDEIGELLDGEPRYRVDQVWHGLYERLATVPEMTNLPGRLRDRLDVEPRPSAVRRRDPGGSIVPQRCACGHGIPDS